MKPHQILFCLVFIAFTVVFGLAFSGTDRQALIAVGFSAWLAVVLALVALLKPFQRRQPDLDLVVDDYKSRTGVEGGPR